jgi:hypothetical protein
MDYTDRVLIKLKRQYSESETVAALSKKVTDLEIQNGKLLSEIQHLEHEEKEAIPIKRDKLKNEGKCAPGNKKQSKEIKKLRRQRGVLMYQVLMLKQKYENL